MPIRALPALVLAAPLLAAAALAGAPARADCVLERVMTLPVTMVGTRPSVEVQLDGDPVRLEVDSGAFFSTLSAAATAQLGLRTSPAPYNFRVTGVGGEAAKVDLTKARFGIGKAELPSVDFVVVPGLQADYGIVGLLGRNFLQHWDVDYDLSHGQITFLRARDCGGKSLAYWNAGATMLPMTAVQTTTLRPAEAWVKVNGRDLKALFDTGAGTSGLTLSGARKAGLDVHGPGAVAAGYSHGIGRRNSQSWLVPVAEMRIGDETIKTTKIRVSDFTSDSFDMLIGADFFLSHHVYVANGQQRVYFTYNGGPVFDLSVKPNAAPPPEPAATIAAVDAPARPAMEGAPGGPPAAVAAAEAAASPDEPKDADGYSRRGQAYAARGDTAHALADLTRAVELDGQNPRYLRERAQLRLNTRQQFLAMADLDAALKLAPDDAEAHLIRARLRATGRDRAGEEADLEAADRAAPKQADLRLNLASLFAGLDHNDRAVAQYDQWLTFHAGDSREPIALNGRCWARARDGRDLDQALRDCDSALRLQPRTAAFLDSRGLVRFKRGELDRARADYDAALALQPKQPLALYVRGVLRARQGDAAGAQADMAAAVALNAQVAEVAHRAGVVAPSA